MQHIYCAVHNEERAAIYGGRTMAQTLHLDIPSASRLRKARAFLCEADLLVADVKSLLSDGANFARSPGSRTLRVASPTRFGLLSG